MNPLDDVVIGFLNRFAGAYPRFDLLVLFLSNHDLLKGGMLVVLLWWLWFRPDDHQRLRREHLVATLLASLVAIAVGRGLQNYLPFRHRPIQDPDLQFVPPYGSQPEWWDSATSFPSDHAVLFFALATGVWFASRSAGLLAVGYVLLIMALPRVYLGIHYPTDIIAGAVIGAAICAGFNVQRVRTPLAAAGMRLHDRKPEIFFPVFFLTGYQISVLFGDLRKLGWLAAAGARAFLHLWR